MAAGWALHLWNEWSIQILVLLSFSLQVFIFLFAGMRQGNSRIWRILLWLAYLSADTTALYTVGHISNSQLPELRPAAFWAQFLLLHLGGQDTMTAYAIEDNQLWLRHLLTLVLQALGAAYVLYRHIADGGALLVMAAVLIYLVGFMKYGERVWTLRSSSHEGITNLLDIIEIDQHQDAFVLDQHRDAVLDQSRDSLVESNLELNRALPPIDLTAPLYEEAELSHQNAEDVLLAAHSLLHICIGQFVDYKIWLSAHEKNVIGKYCMDKDKLFELTGMQLSLMHDIFYTKAVVIHTWYGCCIRGVSLASTVTALLLFRFKSGKDGYTRADLAFTYTLLGGAIALEMASILRAIGSSWTCAMCRKKVSSRWRTRLLSTIMFFRRLLDSAQRGRMWSGSVGQHNLLGMYNRKQDFSSRIARITGLENWLNKERITGTVDISGDSKALVLEEVRRIVVACKGSEDTMWSYRGQMPLRALEIHSESPINYSDWCVDGTEFDESIIAWHIATNVFLLESKDHPKAEESTSSQSQQLKDAIKLLSNYMMFLLVEHPYMLPSPVRARQYDLAYRFLVAEERDPIALRHSSIPTNGTVMDWIFLGLRITRPGSNEVISRGAFIAAMLLDFDRYSSVELERVILGVWVEMLCYAASHCSRDSHAKHLNTGAQFITVVWILQNRLFNSINGTGRPAPLVISAS